MTTIRKTPRRERRQGVEEIHEEVVSFHYTRVSDHPQSARVAAFTVTCGPESRILREPADLDLAQPGDVVEQSTAYAVHHYLLLAITPWRYKDTTGRNFWLLGRCAVCGAEVAIRKDEGSVFRPLLRTCDRHRCGWQQKRKPAKGVKS